MIKDTIDRLQFLCETIPALLLQLSEEDFLHKAAPEKWSKKEILGHLIDSATNNHQRFVRPQFEEVPTISYDQNNWNKFGFYSKIATSHLIRFWTQYNLHIVQLMEHMPTENLKRECITGKDRFSIEYIFKDYVRHLEHHLKQLVNY